MVKEIISQPGASSSSPLTADEWDARFRPFGLDCNSLDKVIQALRKEGLESASNLIVGVDFTRSNEWTGESCFNGSSLHAIGHTPNPYEQVIKIIGETLSEFSRHNPIHFYGFGDVSTRNKDVFCFFPNGRPCNGYTEALERYRKLVPHLKLAGPTSFVPLIEMAITLVERSGGEHHVLLIIADGQDAVRIDSEAGQVKILDQKTLDAIASASNFPLSIVLVGVGNGPWDMMKSFDHMIPPRPFDNFQFVNFSEFMKMNTAQTRKEAAFAFVALSKIPKQFKAAMEIGILGQNISVSPGRTPLAPPIGTLGVSLDRSESFRKTSTDAENTWLSSPDIESDVAALDITTDTCGSQTCGICYNNYVDMAFGCGHRVCCNCEPKINKCHICRAPITTRIKLQWNETLYTESTPAYDVEEIMEDGTEINIV